MPTSGTIWPSVALSEEHLKALALMEEPMGQILGCIGHLYEDHCSKMLSQFPYKDKGLSFRPYI